MIKKYESDIKIEICKEIFKDLVLEFLLEFYNFF